MAAPAPADAASFTLLREQLEEVLETLTIREKRVLELRFGLEDGRSRTLEEVGQHFGVTRERIRQIEAKALRKLRHPSRCKKVRPKADKVLRSTISAGRRFEPYWAHQYLTSAKRSERRSKGLRF